MGSPLFAKHRYLDDTDRLSAYQALQMAYNVHDGQCRRDGQPFITHPVAVAELVASRGMDSQCVIAALLHDAVEDTPLTFAEVEESFGSEVRALVQGVTRVSKMDPSKLDERTDVALSPDAGADADALLASWSLVAERSGEARGGSARMGLGGDSAALLSQCGASDDLLRLLHACAGDWRVAVLKVADRLHNMRTLGAMAPHKRAKKAQETERVFVPLAHYLGAHEVGRELARLSARYRSDGLTGHEKWAARARSTLAAPGRSAVDGLGAVLRKVGIMVGKEGMDEILCSLPAASLWSSSSGGRRDGEGGGSLGPHDFKAPVIPRRELGSERRLLRLIQQLDVQMQMPDRGRELYVSLRPLHERLTRHQAVTMRETDWSPERR